MGAKQRAQNRGKKTKQGGMKGSPRSQRQLNLSMQVPSLNPNYRGQALQGWQSYANGNDHGLTMNEEARNTGRRGFTWSLTPLRNNAVTFVSAGNLTREDAAEADAEEETEVSNENIPGIKDGIANAMVTESESLPSQPTVIEERIIIDVAEPEEEVSAAVTEPIARNPDNLGKQAVIADSLDDSESEEEIVFTGRQSSTQPSRKPSTKPESTAKNVEPQFKSTTKPVPIPSSSRFGLPAASSAPTAMHSSSSIPRSMNSKILHRHMLRGFNDEEALMQDYIDNMALDDSDDIDQTNKPVRKNEHFRFHKGSGEENAKVQTLSYVRKTQRNAFVDQAIDWDSDDLADFDDLSTTDEDIGEVDQIIRHRERESGHQYLVVGTGWETSDAKWVLHNKLISESAVNEIKIYEEIRTMNIEEEDDDEDEEEESSEGEDEEALQDLIDHIESEDEENARIFKHTSRMTDEQIARVLAKQEELGMGGDELILLNGDFGDEKDIDEDEFGLGRDFVPFMSRKQTPRARRNQRQRDSFPPAEAFADALEQDPYGAFDIMDFDRPSLRPKKKGRKSDYPSYLDGVEDEDLKYQLASTWTKDREKKARRKREKEEARLAATLDATDGSDPATIKLRVRQFLVQDVDILKLSPMDSATRAAVHRLAKSLKLNSRSEGKEGVGIGRYPVLTKTPRTPSYSIENIWEIDALMNTRKFFPKSSFKSTKIPRGSGPSRQLRRGGGGVMSGATYRDGEEVAASAPEIGAENRGRAMLEKMGWTVGMGIGAIGNKGGLDPIKHIVKTTKAGLG